MKTLIKGLVLLAVLSLGVAAFADITIGNYDSGNCYPFMCNDSGTNIGQSLDLQQAFNSGAFGGQTTISSLTWYFDAADGGNPFIIGGNYAVSWGYSAVGLNLGSNLPANYSGPSHALGSFSGNVGDNPSFTWSAFTPFTYDPALGDLILEFVVTNQDNVPNGSGNGYNEADYTGADTLRAYCITNVGCFSAVDGALRTTFGTSAATPEPGTFLMLGSGVLGVAGLIRRKMML